MKEREMEREFLQTLRRFGRLHPGHVMDGVNQGEFAVLAALGRWREKHGKEQARVSALAELVKSSPQALSRTLRSLEAKGYIERMVDERDRRNVFVCLTEEGEMVLKSGKERLREQFTEVAARMGEENLRELLRLMNRLADVIQTIMGDRTCEKETMKKKENEDA